MDCACARVYWLIHKRTTATKKRHRNPGHFSYLKTVPLFEKKISISQLRQRQRRPKAAQKSRPFFVPENGPAFYCEHAIFAARAGRDLRALTQRPNWHCATRSRETSSGRPSGGVARAGQTEPSAIDARACPSRSILQRFVCSSCDQTRGIVC